VLGTSLRRQSLLIKSSKMAPKSTKDEGLCMEAMAV